MLYCARWAEVLTGRIELSASYLERDLQHLPRCPVHFQSAIRMFHVPGHLSQPASQAPNTARITVPLAVLDCLVIAFGQELPGEHWNPQLEHSVKYLILVAPEDHLARTLD